MTTFIVEFEDRTESIQALDEYDALEIASGYGSWLSLMEDDTSWGYV